MQEQADMGRKRQNDPMRDIYRDERWGCYVWRPYLGKGRRGKAIKLTSLDQPISAVLAAREALELPQNDFEWLSGEYLKSAWYRQKSHDTQLNYRRYHHQLCNLPMTDGHSFGRYLVDTDIDGLLLREYLDGFIGEDGERLRGYVLANRQFSYIQTVFAWGRNYGKTKNDPCSGIKKTAEKPKKHYVQDIDYYHALYMPGHEYIPFVMELAYLCRARKAVEVLNIKVVDDGKNPCVTSDGILLRRGKGSKTQLIPWSKRLFETVEAAKHLYGIRSTVWLVHNRGKKITTSALDQAWQRRMIAMALNGGARFSLHNLKTRGVTDFEGDKHLSTGDKSKAMVSVYDLSVEVAQPTR